MFILGFSLEGVITWPSGKLPFECQKIAKNLTFFFKLTKNVIFSTKLPLAILLKKMTIFVNFFEKMSSCWQFFDIQMSIFRRVRMRRMMEVVIFGIWRTNINVYSCCFIAILIVILPPFNCNIMWIILLWPQPETKIFYFKFMRFLNWKISVDDVFQQKPGTI